MKIFAQWLSSAIVVLVALMFSAPRPAFADSYTIYDLGDDNAHGIYGIDSAGDVVIWGGSGCGISSLTCYVTYLNGVATNDSGTPPILTYDDGTSCASAPAGFNVSKSVCNDGWIGFGSFYYPGGGAHGVYTGSGSDLQLLHSGSADQVFLNSVGDFAWTDGLDDEMFVAIRNSDTTPEPGTLLLVATGVVGITAMIRRRTTRYRNLAE